MDTQMELIDKLLRHLQSEGTESLVLDYMLDDRKWHIDICNTTGEGV